MGSLKKKTSSAIIIGLSSLGLLAAACNKPSAGASNQPASQQEKQNLDSLVHPNATHGLPAGSSASVDGNASVCFDQICQNTPDISAALKQDSPVEEPLLQQMKSLIKQSYKLDADVATQNYTKMKKIDMLHFQPSGNVGDLVFASYAIGRLFQNGSYLTTQTGDLHYHFDFVRYLQDHSHDELPINQELADEIESILSLGSITAVIKGLTWRDYADTLMKGTSAANHLDFTAIVAADIDKTLRTFSKYLGQPYVTTLALKKALAHQELSAAEQRNFFVQYFTTDLVKEVNTGRLQGAFVQSGFMKSRLYQKLMGTSVDEVFQNLMKDQELHLQNCIKNTELTLFLSLTDAEKANLEKTVVSVQQFAKSEIRDWIKDPALLQNVSNNIDKTQFKLPDTRSQIAEVLLEKYQSDLQSNQPVNSDDILWAGFFMSLSSKTKSDESIKSDLENECADYLPQPVSDHARTSLGNISLSVSSAKDLRIGFAITAHELGHIVFSALSGVDDVPSQLSAFGSVENVMTCELSRVNDMTLYLNESFADSFSAHVMSKANEVAEKTNVGCSILNNLNSGLSLVNSDKSDVHPANFFRALIFHQDMNKSLPAACNQYLQSQGMKSPLQSCY